MAPRLGANRLGRFLGGVEDGRDAGARLCVIHAAAVGVLAGPLLPVGIEAHVV
jgi:hypothetical protein